MDKKITEKAKIGDFIILAPDGLWYDFLGLRDELKESGYSVLVLDRFVNTSFMVIPEKEMNRLGWYKR